MLHLESLPKFTVNWHKIKNCDTTNHATWFIKSIILNVIILLTSRSTTWLNMDCMIRIWTMEFFSSTSHPKCLWRSHNLLRKKQKGAFLGGESGCRTKPTTNFHPVSSLLMHRTTASTLQVQTRSMEFINRNDFIFQLKSIHTNFGYKLSLAFTSAALFWN